MAVPEHYSPSQPRSKRNVIFEYIKNNPGTHFSAIKRALDMDVGVIQYHINMLLKIGKIKSKTEGNRKIFFPWDYGRTNADEHEYLINEIRRRYLLLSPKEQEVFEIIFDHGPITIKQIAKMTNIRFARHVKPYLTNIERKMGVVITRFEGDDGYCCEIDFERYSDLGY